MNAKSLILCDLEVVMCDWQDKNEENDRMRKFYGFDLAQTAREDF